MFSLQKHAKLFEETIIRQLFKEMDHASWTVKIKPVNSIYYFANSNNRKHDNATHYSVKLTDQMHKHK